MKILKKIRDKFWFRKNKYWVSDKSTFWYVFKNYILLKKGSYLIAACFVFLFISSPIVLLLWIFDFIIIPSGSEGNGQGFGLALILSIVMGVIHFISSEYRGYYIIREFITHVSHPCRGEN